MMKQIGWRRLWLAISAVIVAALVVRSLRYPNVMNVTGSDWDCLPGTYSESAVLSAKGAVTFSCTSYAGLIFAIVAGLLISIAIAVIFCLARKIVGPSRKS